MKKRITSNKFVVSQLEFSAEMIKTIKDKLSIGYFSLYW